MTAMKLLRSPVGKNRANLQSAYVVDSCVASLPAPPPPPCFAGTAEASRRRSLRKVRRPKAAYAPPPLSRWRMRSDAPLHRHRLLIGQTLPTAFAVQNTAAECAIRKFSSPGLIGLIVRASRPVLRGRKGTRPQTWRLIMSRIPVVAIVSLLAVLLAALGGMALAAQDKYALQLPGGLPFSDFRGYEDWQVVSVSQTDDLLKGMVPNPAMIDAYKACGPGNGQP